MVKKSVEDVKRRGKEMDEWRKTSPDRYKHYRHSKMDASPLFRGSNMSPSKWSQRRRSSLGMLSQAEKERLAP